MTKLNEVYKCNVCGNIVEMVHTGVGELVCCAQPMVLQDPNTVDAAQEKHVPVVEKTDKGVKVTIGSNPHPMTEEHYIEWIEVIVNGEVKRHHLKPGDEPSAEFCCVEVDKVEARAYCNLHGLWKS
jgi:superoxide reductase